ncbi:hypothetical protein ABPG75_004363 [Micractinium tetrahymenae]
MEMYRGGQQLRWQLDTALSRRVMSLAELLVKAGADPNAIDEQKGRAAAARLEALTDPLNDYEGLDSDDEMDYMDRLELRKARLSCCMTETYRRLDRAALCQAPLRAAVRLRDAGLVRLLLSAGADVAGGPGGPLLQVAA